MAWMPVDQHIGRSPKTLALARKLNWTPRYTVGFLVDLWGWSIDGCPSGLVAQVPPETLAKAVGMPPADVARVTRLMREVGWIDSTPPNEGRLHEWEEWAGRVVEGREKERTKKRKKRAESRLSPGTPGPVPRDSVPALDLPRMGMSRGTSESVPGDVPPVEQSREEKRRVPPSPTRSTSSGGYARDDQARRAVTAAVDAEAERERVEAQAEDVFRALVRGRRRPEWGAAIAAMREAGTSRANLVTWFRDTDLLDTRGGYAVMVPNAFAQEWVAGKYGRQVRDALELVMGRTDGFRVQVALEGTPIEEPVEQLAIEAAAADADDDEPGFDAAGL